MRFLDHQLGGQIGAEALFEHCDPSLADAARRVRLRSQIGSFDGRYPAPLRAFLELKAVECALWLGLMRVAAVPKFLQILRIPQPARREIIFNTLLHWGYPLSKKLERRASERGAPPERGPAMACSASNYNVSIELQIRRQMAVFLGKIYPIYENWLEIPV